MNSDLNRVLASALQDQPVEFPCPHCHHQFSLKLGDLQSGESIECPACQQGIKLNIKTDVKLNVKQSVKSNSASSAPGLIQEDPNIFARLLRKLFH